MLLSSKMEATTCFIPVVKPKRSVCLERLDTLSFPPLCIQLHCTFPPLCIPSSLHCLLCDIFSVTQDVSVASLTELNDDEQNTFSQGCFLFPVFQHPRWKEAIQFLLYQPPPLNPTDEASVEEWLERAAFLEEDLHQVLKLPHGKFWCQVDNTVTVPWSCCLLPRGKFWCLVENIVCTVCNPCHIFTLFLSLA